MTHTDSDRFLIKLFEATRGNTAAQSSMYDIGAKLDLDREVSLKIAEDLMARNWVEVRTLSGGIGLTDDGVSAARKLGAGGPSDQIKRLSKEPMLNDADRLAVETLAAAIKAGIPKMRLTFDLMAELAADLRTIDAQLASPKPKTPVFRECFTSIKIALEKGNAPENLARVKELLQ